MRNALATHKLTSRQAITPSDEYARKKLYVLKIVWTRLTFSIKDWEKEVAEAKKNEIWKQLGYESLDDVLEKEVESSQVEICVKAFRKSENRIEAFKMIILELEPHEIQVVKELAKELSQR